MTNEGAVALSRVWKRSACTQAEFAETIGLAGNSYITRLLSGKRKPSWELATRIESIFPSVKVSLWQRPCDVKRAA